jgi:hypothetical protein
MSAARKPKAQALPPPSPAPWSLEVLSNVLRVVCRVEDRDNRQVGDDVAVLGDCRDPENQANGRLIVAAPDLLAACQRSRAVLDELFAVEGELRVMLEQSDLWGALCDAYDANGAAIEKATVRP